MGNTWNVRCVRRSGVFGGNTTEYLGDKEPPLNPTLPHYQEFRLRLIGAHLSFNKMKKVTIQINAPVNIEIEVSILTEDSLLDAAWNDLKDPKSTNNWKPSYDDLKDVLRSAYFEEGDWCNFIEDGQNFIVAYT